MIRLFSRKPTPSDAGRQLAELRCLKGRELIRARARLMCAEMGREIPGALR